MKLESELEVKLALTPKTIAGVLCGRVGTSVGADSPTDSWGGGGSFGEGGASIESGAGNINQSRNPQTSRRKE